MEIKNIDQLISEYYRMHPNGHYFDKETLKFFGERKSDMRLLKDTVHVKSYSGEHECYMISKLQRNHPMGARRTYAFFDVETLEDIIPVND